MSKCAPELLYIVGLPVLVLLLGLQAWEVFGKVGASCDGPFCQRVAVGTLQYTLRLTLEGFSTVSTFILGICADDSCT